MKLRVIKMHLIENELELIDLETNKIYYLILPDRLLIKRIFAVGDELEFNYE